MTALAAVTSALDRLFGGRKPLELAIGPCGPMGDLDVPNAADGCWHVQEVQGRHCLAPDDESHYLYFVLPEAWRARAPGALWLEVTYFGDRHGLFRVQYASRDAAAEAAGLYTPAEQRWRADAVGLRRWRKAVFPLPNFDTQRTQNLGASFRVEFREEVLIAALSLTTAPPADAAAYTAVAPLPELKKLPGRFYPINYLFVEITNACNFKCTWCPDDIMGRRRGFMKKQQAFSLLDQIAESKPRIGPLYPIKLHQMGEPMLHPELPAIVERAERLGLGIELNTNCGLITEEKVDALYRAGLTNLILSYQTPDAVSFKTRKAPRLPFDDYRDKVRLAVRRKLALRARTQIEIDIMNTKHADGYVIVSEDEQALAFLRDWIAYCQGLEAEFGLPPRVHDWDQIRSRHFLDQDENGSRYPLLDGVHLIWKRCHSWGNVIGGHDVLATKNTYCPAPYEQFVVQWNGDVATCCTDYEGRTKIANVFNESVESIWLGRVLRQRKQDMLDGRLLDVCAKCIGVK